MDGYDRMDFDISFSKPFLRKEMELRMKAICEGTSTRHDVMRDSIRQYKRVFMDSKQRASVLKSVSSIAVHLALKIAKTIHVTILN